MAKPKKATKVKNQNTSAKPPIPASPPSAIVAQPPAPPTTTPKPPQAKVAHTRASPTFLPMASKADQVRTIWKTFLTTFYNPAYEAFSSSDIDNDEDKFRESIKVEWARRLADKGLVEQDWDPMTPAEQVAVYEAFFGVVCDEKDIASIEASMQSVPASKSASPTLAAAPSTTPSPPQPVASSSKHALVSPPPAMSPALSSSSSSAYTTISAAAFRFDAEDSDEESSEFGIFETLSDGNISTPISPSSMSSHNWWTSDSLQTSPSTSPSSKPVMVDFPVTAGMLEDELPGAFPALWKPSTSASHMQTESPSTPLGKITEWFSALNPTSEPPIRAPEWPDEPMWGSGQKEDKMARDKAKVPKAVDPENVDWTLAWKTAQAEEASALVKEEPQPKQKGKAKGKKDAARPSPPSNDTKHKADAAKVQPIPVRDRKQSISTPFGEPLRSRKSSISHPEAKTTGGWKKAETPIPIPAPKRQLETAMTNGSAWSSPRMGTKPAEQVDWASALQTLQQEEIGNAYDWSDNDEPQTPIVNPRATVHNAHSLSHLEIPQSLSSASSASDYIGPVLSDPSDYGLTLTPATLNSPDVEKMENEFAEFKIATRVQFIRAFHAEAVEQEIKLSTDLHRRKISKAETSKRFAEHQFKMVTLQRDKENERKQMVDEERKRRVSELERKASEQKKLDMEAFAQEQLRVKERQFQESQALAHRRRQEEEEARIAELRAKEEELQRKEKFLHEQEQQLRRREEEVQRQRQEERQEEDRRRWRADEARKREREEQHRAEEQRRSEEQQQQRQREEQQRQREEQQRQREEQERRLQEQRSREEQAQRRDEAHRRREEHSRARSEEDPARRRQIEKDEELARQLEQRERQELMHRRQQEILDAKKAAREANNATVRPADRQKWGSSATTEPERSKRPSIPTFGPTPDPSPASSSRTSTPWQSTGLIPAPPKMTRVVDFKAPLAVVSKAEASSSKLTLEHVRPESTAPQPPRLVHKSASSTPDNRTIWHPKPEPKPEPMSRSTRIEKAKSTSVVQRTRTLSDPVPPSPRMGTKALPGGSSHEKGSSESSKTAVVESKAMVIAKKDGKKKASVTVEDVPEPEETIGGGLPADSTALMLSNVEPDSPSLVEQELKEKADREKEKEKEKHRRWTPPAESANATATATTRPRAGSSAKRGRGF